MKVGNWETKLGSRTSYDELPKINVKRPVHVEGTKEKRGAAKQGEQTEDKKEARRECSRMHRQAVRAIELRITENVNTKYKDGRKFVIKPILFVTNSKQAPHAGKRCAAM